MQAVGTLAACAALAAIMWELAAVKDLTGWTKGAHIGLAGATILTAWTFIHLLYALHYAHEYYGDRRDAAGEAVEDRKGLRFPGIPRFPAEHFGVLRCAPSSRKAFTKGLDELLQEGAIQGFREPAASGNDLVLGAVGPLQFEVLQYRLAAEYGAKTDLEKLQYKVARWLQGPPEKLADLREANTCRLLEDLDGRPVGLFRDVWSLESTVRNNAGVAFLAVAPVA